VEGGQEISVVARGLEKNFVAGYRAGYGVQERDNGGSGAACGDGGEGSGEEMVLDGSLGGGGIPELGGDEDDVKGREQSGDGYEKSYGCVVRRLRLRTLMGVG